MSIAFELYKTTGKTPCPPGSQRVKRCPLILNPDSEDVLTGEVFNNLKNLWPEMWLPSMLQCAYCQQDFRFLEYENFSIEFWKKIHATILNSAWSEFDAYIAIPPIKVVIECKYLSPIDEAQIIRYLDIISYHHYQKNCEDTYFLLITNDETEPEILKKYRDPEQLMGKVNELRPFVNYKKLYAYLAQNIGWISWRQILSIVEGIPISNLHYSEKAIVDDLKKYLAKKLKNPKLTK